MLLSDFQRMRAAADRPLVEVGDHVEFNLPHLRGRLYRVEAVEPDEVILVSDRFKVHMANLPADAIIHKATDDGEQPDPEDA